MLINKALELTNLLRLCHTIDECTAKDREQALLLIQTYLDKIIS